MQLGLLRALFLPETEALLGLSGHSLTVGSLAWQERTEEFLVFFVLFEDFGGGHRVLCGAQEWGFGAHLELLM